jgi:hypothetical protein
MKRLIDKVLLPPQSDVEDALLKFLAPRALETQAAYTLLADAMNITSGQRRAVVVTVEGQETRGKIAFGSRGVA